MLAIATARVELDEALRAVHLEADLTDAEAFATLRALPEDTRPGFVLRALKVGLVVLRDAQPVAQADHVAREFERLRADFQAQLDGAFGPEGRVSRELREVFGDQGSLDRRLAHFLGPDGRCERVLGELLGEGGALQRSLDGAVGEDGDFHRTLDAYLGERGRLRQELDREFGPEGGRLFRILNPDDARTPLGQLRRGLEERFDPTREGSALWDLKADLRAQIAQLRADLGVQEAVAAERAVGHGKGFDFEDHVTDLLAGCAAAHGDLVEDVSDAKGPLGDVGDALVTLDPEATGGAPRRIVVEAKARRVALTGKGSIHRELDEAMRNRDAHFAIAAVEAAHAASFAPLRYVAPDHLLVAVDPEAPDPLPLRVAYQLARALVVARAQRREAALDVEDLAGRLQGIAQQLETVRAMKVGLGSAIKGIEGVRDNLDALRSNIQEAVDALLRDVQRAEPGR